MDRLRQRVTVAERKDRTMPQLSMLTDVSLYRLFMCRLTVRPCLLHELLVSCNGIQWLSWVLYNMKVAQEA